MKVLVVDDSEMNRKLLEASLTAEGMEILVAADGLEALELLGRESVDAVISDVLMPRIDGYRLCYEIRKDDRFKAIPIIIYSASYISAPDEKLALDIGADSFLKKPASTQEIVAALDQAIATPRVDRNSPNRSVAEIEVMKEYSERLIDKLEQKNIELENAGQMLLETNGKLVERTEELKAISQQLWQAAKLASVGELAATVAHELNNPLAIVGLMIESLLEQTPADDPKRHALEVIEQEVARMGHQVARLLQFSRSSQPQISTVDVTEEIASTLDLVRNHLRNRGVNVVTDFQPGISTIQADREQLRQLCLNLLTNAADAMPKGGTVAVRVAPCSINGNSPALGIEFADTGAGIASEDLSKITEPFYTTKPEGTGLGLAICKRIVQEHHGVLEITSVVGHGTVVRSTLPISAAR
ncbi:MAG TPA: response regulator [Blastocatellia bacterium]|nr:response regulator [Blastocatellia bacterium]